MAAQRREGVKELVKIIASEQVLALLGRGTLFSAPFRLDFEGLPADRRLRVPRSLLHTPEEDRPRGHPHQRPPASSFLTTWIRLREMSWRLARPWSVSPAMKSRATCRLNSMLWMRCLATAFIL